jgi:hypothetical protein
MPPCGQEKLNDIHGDALANRKFIMSPHTAVLNLRGWAQSERFDQAWALLAATYQVAITVLNDVVSIRSARR